RRGSVSARRHARRPVGCRHRHPRRQCRRHHHRRFRYRRQSHHVLACVRLRHPARGRVRFFLLIRRRHVHPDHRPCRQCLTRQRRRQSATTRFPLGRLCPSRCPCRLPRQRRR